MGWRDSDPLDEQEQATSDIALRPGPSPESWPKALPLLEFAVMRDTDRSTFYADALYDRLIAN
jgi:hypothetical protein